MVVLSWTPDCIDGQDVWIGETAVMKLTLIPKLGSKVISLYDKRTGREWLSRTELPLGNKGYASSFVDGDGSGWDEMFPTINECSYSGFPWEGTLLPDHGEVWSIPWRAELVDGKLQCDTFGVRMPYHLRKTYSFSGDNQLRIDYTVNNNSPFPMSFIWAAHPLFQVEEGMEIVVPSKLKDIVVSYSHDGRLGTYGDERTWPLPLADQPEIQLNRVEAAAAQTAEKFYFVGELPEGEASLYDPRTGEQLTMSFPKEKVPYLSIWANYGGYLGQYHVAIEPATGLLDDLAYAMEQHSVAEVAGHGTYEWFVKITI